MRCAMFKHPYQSYSHYQIIFDEEKGEIYLSGFDFSKQVWVKLIDLPKTETLYKLIFSIVDNICVHTRQANFSFESDEQAFYFRVAFYCLVRKINPIEKEHEKYLDKFTYEFGIKEFDLVKRFLDVSKGGSSTKGKNKVSRFQQKCEFLGIQDKKLNILENYESDDSDEEIVFPEKDQQFSAKQFQAGIKTFLKKDLKKSTDTKNYYQLPIVSLSESVHQDLALINHVLKTSLDPKVPRLKFDKAGHLIHQDKAIKTLFAVPSFRGINHMHRFSDEVRRIRRTKKFQTQITGQSYFSESVLMDQFDFYQDAETTSKLGQDDNLLKLLKDKAETLEQQLLNLKQQDFVLVHNLSGGKNHFFSNLLHALQHVYSNGIVKLQRLQRFLIENTNISLQLLNAYNPFVSESETPYHAMRYACGLKSLYENAARRPCYHKDGKPTFPYIGEVSISLRTVQTIMGQYERNVLRQLSGVTTIKPSYEIAPELEATGFAWIPGDELVFSEVIKCPNFRSAYKTHYAEKFGLNKTLFEKFKFAIINAANDEERLQVEQNVLEWLCHYKSVDLMNKAIELAKQRGYELIFSASDFGLTDSLPHRDAVCIDNGRQIMLEKLADHLYQNISDQKVFLKEKLTSNNVSFYVVDEGEIKKALKDLGYSDVEINQFLLQEDILRTPPSIEKKSRSSLFDKTESDSPYKKYVQEGIDGITTSISHLSVSKSITTFSSIFGPTKNGNEEKLQPIPFQLQTLNRR